MIAKHVIESLYRKYPKPPKSLSNLNLDKLIAVCGNLYGAKLSDDTISFAQLGNSSPFHSILLRNICGIEKFEYHIALVTSSYILFFNRDKVDVTVHFKPETISCLKRIYHRIKQQFFHSFRP